MKTEVQTIRRAFGLLLLLAASSLISCRSNRPPADVGFEFTDGLGRRVALAGMPERIITFAPSLTEMVFALGGEGRLVGVTAWCNYPPRAKYKPAVGDYNSPNWERMAALRPDLVLLVGSADSPMLPRLEALGIPAAVFRSETFEDIRRDLALVGELLGRKALALALSESLRLQADSLRTAVGSIPADRRPRVFAEIADRPLMTGSDRSFLGQLIALAGGRNVAGDMPQDYAAVDPEMVVDRKPDIILVLHPGTSLGEVSGRIGWSSIPAVKNGRIVTGLDLDLLMRPGPRFPLAARSLFEVFHGQR